MAAKRIDALLKNAKELEDLGRKTLTPQLNRGLTQIGHESYLLSTKFGPNQDLSTITHHVLAQGGANTQELTENLKKLDLVNAFEKEEFIPDTDVESYLNEVKKDYVIETIEEARQNIRKDFLNELEDGLFSNWEDKKRGIFESWSNELENKTFGGRSTQTIEKQSKHKEQMLCYLSVVEDINVKRLLLDRVDTVDRFKAISMKIKPEANILDEMNNAWDIAAYVSKKVVGPFRERIVSDRDVVNMKCSLIDVSREWLEKQFMSLIKSSLTANDNRISTGGNPSLEHRLTCYMKHAFQRNGQWTVDNLEVVADTPIWLYLYLLVRCGLLDLALKYMKDNSQVFHLSPAFPEYFKEYAMSPNRTLCETTLSLVFSDHQRMRFGNLPFDPYKQLLYLLIGRCEKVTRPLAIINIEDYLWLQLNLVREKESPETPLNSRYTLNELQEALVKNGPEHFNDTGKNPWLYFCVLLLSCQYERAIDYLYTKEKYRLEAVHFAISFVYSGVLQIFDEPHVNTVDLLVYESENVSLNFSRLISQYIQLFDIEEHTKRALNYIFLLTLYPTEEMKIVCKEQVCEFITSHPNSYKEILGTINKDGHIRTNSGYIERYKPLICIDTEDQETYNQTVLNEVAQIFDWEGEYKDAVNVYELSGEYIAGLQVLNDQIDHALSQSKIYHLSDNIQIEEKQKEKNKDLVEYSKSVMKNYTDSLHYTSIPDHEAVRVNTILRKFLEAAIEYDAGRHTDALKTIDSADILPTSKNYSYILQAKDDFNKLSNEIIKKHIAHIILMVSLVNTNTERALALTQFVALIDLTASPYDMRDINLALAKTKPS